MTVDERKIKQVFKKKAQKSPSKYYPVDFLESEGFVRKKCKKCGTFFWSVDEAREICDDPNCTGFYSFIGDSPSPIKMDFVKVWKEFARIFKNIGYTPIQRYPVVARWREDMDFVIASIANFQPHVVSGEVEPPANPLVIPQFCLRFTDIENVGITGRHYTGFVMIGQHAFVPAKQYDQEEYLEHIYIWLTRGLKLLKKEIVFHEDVWAGGGNMGPSMEFFTRSLEIGNQVYMMFDIRDGTVKELPIKVLDMGMGQERCAWLTTASATSYEANMPTVTSLLYKTTGVKQNHDLVERFLPYSGMLNIDEVENVEKIWSDIANKIGVDVVHLKKQILDMAAVYSVADHTRSLLFAIGDGALPSNVGGGYNLRVILRRIFDLMDEHGWNFDLSEVLESHAKYMKPQYPELMDSVDHVAHIFDIERRKYRETKKMARKIIASLKKDKIDEARLIELYDSKGISPEMLVKEGIDIVVPKNFYSKITELHERKGREQARMEKTKIEKTEFSGIKPTEILYYDDYRLVEFKAKVLKVLNNRYIVLDKTAFYPTSGGQLHDIGWIDGIAVKDVFKIGSVIVHELEDASRIKEGIIVECKIDLERRVKLAQLHTATHIINGAARELLGRHVWQAGAEKRPDKARLDITHYESLSEEQIDAIEKEANKVVLENLPVKSVMVERNKAESKYGFVIYQGGAVPGKILRIVEIPGLDVEACGGTHVKKTGDVGPIKIIGTSKIQDGVVRLEFVAGMSLLEHTRKMERYLRESCRALDVNPEHLPKTVARFFREWKKQRKEIERLKEKIASFKTTALNIREIELAGIKFHVFRVEKIEMRHFLRLVNEKASEYGLVLGINFIGNGVQLALGYTESKSRDGERLKKKLEESTGIKMRAGKNIWVGGGKANILKKVPFLY